MREFATKHDFPFPYLHDETQGVARAYGAVCTPDFFGFDRDLKLEYRGRLDEGRTTPPPPNARREPLEAMRAIAAGGAAPANQVPSIGCSIKWKAGRGRRAHFPATSTTNAIPGRTFLRSHGGITYA
jgi:hypothetical protein